MLLSDIFKSRTFMQSCHADRYLLIKAELAWNAPRDNLSFVSEAVWRTWLEIVAGAGKDAAAEL